MTPSIGTVSVPVSDQAAASEFYHEMLGYKVSKDAAWGGGSRWLELAPEAGGVGITLVTWFEAMPPGSLQGLVLYTDDLLGLHSHLTEKGADVSPLQEQFYGQFFTLRDPDGNGLVINGR